MMACVSGLATRFSLALVLAARKSWSRCSVDSKRRDSGLSVRTMSNAAMRGRRAGSVPVADSNKAFAKDVPWSAVTWEHRIPEPFPASIPHAANSLDEVYLRGSFNLNLEPGGLQRIVGEAFRALRPGGLLRMHGLGGDRPLDGALPPLPGPAAVAERVPPAIEPMQMMVAAGLIDVQFERLSQTAHFTIAGVPMREVILTGRKPGYRPKKFTHQAVYLGPLAQVTDDFGNNFPRGERVQLNIHD